MQVLHQLAVDLFVGCLFGAIGAALDWRRGGPHARTALALGLVGALVFALTGVAWTAVTGMTVEQEFLGRRSSFGLALVLVTASAVIHAGAAVREALARHRRAKTRAPDDR
jgi:Kef-type K+ transport system membrane component KefB